VIILLLSELVFILLHEQLLQNMAAEVSTKNTSLVCWQHRTLLLHSRTLRSHLNRYSEYTL